MKLKTLAVGSLPKKIGNVNISFEIVDKSIKVMMMSCPNTGEFIRINGAWDSINLQGQATIDGWRLDVAIKDGECTFEQSFVNVQKEELERKLAKMTERYDSVDHKLYETSVPDYQE